MKKPRLVLFFCLFFSHVLSSDKLFYYGEPVHSTQSGFIKIDPQTNAWEIAADGFATLVEEGWAYNGITLSRNDSPLIFGQFNIWNGTYVGCILKLDEESLSPSIFNTGVLGQEISSMVYFNNDTEVAMLGNFVGLQQNPNLVVNRVAACSADGKSCYPLGNGLPDYWYYGVLKSIGQSIYAKYLTFDATFDGLRVSMFNASQTTQGEWQTIYSLESSEDIQFSPEQISIEVYQGDLWMFGIIMTPDNQTVSAARWNSSEFSWEYMYSSGSLLSEDTYRVFTSVSPDGEYVYLSDYDFVNTTTYVWNNQYGNWSEIYTMTCENSPQMSATNQGVLVACNDSIISVPQGNTLPNLRCDYWWSDLSVSSDNTKLYAFCTNSSYKLETFLYQLNPDKILAANGISTFEQLTYQLDSMCVYGSKIMLTGRYQKVGGVNAPTISLWDSKYHNWYQVLKKEVAYCFCDSDGNQVVAVCFDEEESVPILVIDDADTDSGNQSLVANLQISKLMDLVNVNQVLQVQLYEGSVYIASTGSTNMTLYRWTDTRGETLLSVYGWYFIFDIFEDVAYLTGHAGSIGTFTLNAVRYSLTTKSWMWMDQLSLAYNNRSLSPDAWSMEYWNATGNIYVGGRFTGAGGYRAGNWVGYNTMGNVSDTVSGGVQDTVFYLQSLGDRMYFITRAYGCTSVDESGCGNLVYYDAKLKSYSVIVAAGVAIVATGSESLPVDQVSTSGSSSFAAWKVVVIVFAVLFTVALLGLMGFIFYMKFGGKRWKYQEIPDMHPSEQPLSPVDFQHEEFVMKSVLGKGAYGTVWSCVFPHREGGTYGTEGSKEFELIKTAVKQMLFSKGDTKKIETVLQEIDILEKFRHPHIVHYCGHRIEATQTSVEFFIFMELYEQPCSLKGVIQKKIKSGKNAWFTYEEIKSFLIQIADGLNYLHSNGIAHRDLKCANILVRLKGGLVTSLHIADFGISKVLLSEDTVNVLASTVLGTPSFMAPEILTNQKYDALKADMWSFGVMMYEMLSWQENDMPGRKPQFPEEVTEFMNQDLRFEGVLEIYHKCTQQEPNSRPTVSELLFLCESLS